MQIDAFASDDSILIELGDRLKLARIRSGLTQSQLSEESGVAKSTVERAEKGESVQLMSLIKILRALKSIGSLELLLPDTKASPFESLNLKNAEQKKRVRSHQPFQDTSFTWGDEK